MNSTVKTIVVWGLILVAAVGLYQFVEHGTVSPTHMINLTEFLRSAQSGEVRSVVIRGSQVTGRRADNTSFLTTIPAESSAIAERLVAASVAVTIAPEDKNPWIALLLSWAVPSLLVLGCAAVFMRQFRLYLQAPEAPAALPAAAPARADVRLVREGTFLAEVPIEWEVDESSFPSLTAESMQALTSVRESLRRGDLQAARKFARVFRLTDAS